jgi:predicted nucleotidyltransferase
LDGRITFFRVEEEGVRDVNKDQQKENLISTITAQVAPILEMYSAVAAVYLLGSVVTGTLRDDSDIDVALLPLNEQTISMQSRLEMAALLESQLNRTVDVGVITTKNLVYASEAILGGQRILTIDKGYTEVMETRLLGCYFTFRQDRKVVEESYRAA